MIHLSPDRLPADPLPGRRLRLHTPGYPSAVIVFRETGPDDLDDVLRLYRQLQPEDPVVRDGADVAAFMRILSSDGLYLFVLEVDGVVVATTYLNVIPNLTRSASPYAVI